MEDTSQPVASAPVAPPGTTDRKLDKKLIIGGIIVVAVALIALVPMLVKNMQVADALGGARIVVAGSEKDGLYEYSWLGMRQVKVKADGTVTDYARSGEHEAVIVNDDGKSIVYVLGKEPRTVGSALYEKRALSISSDGAWVAFASRKDVGEDMYAWTIQAIEVATGEMVDLGPGTAPQFFARDGASRLMFFAPSGVTIADLSAKTSFTTPFTMPADINNAGAITADGSRFVSRDNNTGAHLLYTVTAVEPYFLPELTGTVAGRLSGAQFVNGALLATEGGALKRVDLAAPGEAETLYSFQDAEATYRLIP